MGTKHYNLMPCYMIFRTNFVFISFFGVLVEKFVKCGQNITIWCLVAINPKKKKCFHQSLTLSRLKGHQCPINFANHWQDNNALNIVGIDKKWKIIPLAFQKCQSQRFESHRSRENWPRMNVLLKIFEFSFEIFKLDFLSPYGR